MLTENEKAAVLSIWHNTSSQVNAVGGEALNSSRLFISFPKTKTTLPHHFDLTPGSADIKAHSGKILNAIWTAANHMDDFPVILSTLTDLQAPNLKVDPEKFNVRMALHYH
ncbi:unnamed protein product [Staurois parvus]|uniref:Globin domain-containing protein n=1 Tax=Staurois parvus TaxID=386267 RepID=A0ABN9CIY1_9NEOB|nr:unnamed protein product [Staurois parvus]